MGLGRELHFWGRVARHNLSSVTLARALDASTLTPRILGHLILIVALSCVGYLIGRVSAPNCGPVPDANCIEAQAAAPVAATPIAAAPAASAPPAMALPAPAAPPSAAAPLAAASVATPELPPAQNMPANGVRALTNDEVREMQAWLKAFGFDPGPIDGVPGSRTKAAIKRYQAARQAEATGQLDRSLLRQVRKRAGHS